MIRLTLDSLLYSGVIEKTFHFNALGRGILRRHKNYLKDWEPHLESTKSVFKSWLSKTTNKDSLNILGAGNLLDVPCPEVTGKFKKLFLSDIDINCLTTWRKKFSNTNFQPVLQDISLTLDSWSNSLTTTDFQNFGSFLEFTKVLHKLTPPTSLSFIKTQNVVSLNLLSQIPIHWQEAAFSIAKTRFNVSKNSEESDLLIQALIPTSSALIKSHLQSLLPIRKGDSSLIISDLKYFFLPKEVDEVKFKDKKDPLSPNVDFVSTKSGQLSIFEQDALCSFSLKNFLDNLPSNVCMQTFDPWIWNIVPKDSRREKKESHLVVAFALSCN